MRTTYLCASDFKNFLNVSDIFLIYQLGYDSLENVSFGIYIKNIRRSNLANMQSQVNLH